MFPQTFKREIIAIVSFIVLIYGSSLMLNEVNVQQPATIEATGTLG
jgi:hypothetical protein